MKILKNGQKGNMIQHEPVLTHLTDPQILPSLKKKIKKNHTGSHL